MQDTNMDVVIPAGAALSINLRIEGDVFEAAVPELATQQTPARLTVAREMGVTAEHAAAKKGPRAQGQARIRAGLSNTGLQTGFQAAIGQGQGAGQVQGVGHQVPGSDRAPFDRKITGSAEHRAAKRSQGIRQGLDNSGLQASWNLGIAQVQHARHQFAGSQFILIIPTMGAYMVIPAVGAYMVVSSMGAYMVVPVMVTASRPAPAYYYVDDDRLYKQQRFDAWLDMLLAQMA